MTLGMWALESELRQPHLLPLAPHRVHRPSELQRDLLVAGRAEQLRLLRRPDPPARMQWRPSAEALGRGREASRSSSDQLRALNASLPALPVRCENQGLMYNVPPGLTAVSSGTLPFAARRTPVGVGSPVWMLKE